MKNLLKMAVATVSLASLTLLVGCPSSDSGESAKPAAKVEVAAPAVDKAAAPSAEKAPAPAAEAVAAKTEPVAAAPSAPSAAAPAQPAH